jgi:saccharopine dehydrogenase-like NADP-dependent oxidoreductase
MHTVLILGGYGFFGQRISAALASNRSIRVLVGGRNGERARATVHALKLPPDSAVAVDAADRQLAQNLRGLRVATLIHTAGPFQGQDYAVARAAIEAGCHYIDLADARDFVTGIDCLDAAAQAHGVSVISGASSVPALSCAVIERYLERFHRLESIHIAISSGARSPGLATLRAVFSYAGRPFSCWHNGAWVDRYGCLDLRRHQFPPPLGRRWLGSCDVADLELFPRRYPGVRTVSFQAGVATDPGQLLVWGLAQLVRAGMLRSLTPLARPLHRLSRWLQPLVSAQGGMFVSLQGQGQDRAPLSLTWNLLARQNHGAHIPCGAAIALASKLAAGAALPAGAMPCTGLLTVEEYLEPLRGLDIRESVT